MRTWRSPVEVGSYVYEHNLRCSPDNEDCGDDE